MTLFTFYDGPSTTNGKPHIGHVLTRVIKDMIPRYHYNEGLHGSKKGRMGPTWTSVGLK